MKPINLLLEDYNNYRELFTTSKNINVLDESIIYVMNMCQIGNSKLENLYQDLFSKILTKNGYQEFEEYSHVKYCEYSFHYIEEKALIYKKEIDRFGLEPFLFYTSKYKGYQIEYDPVDLDSIPIIVAEMDWVNDDCEQLDKRIKLQYNQFINKISMKIVEELEKDEELLIKLELDLTILELSSSRDLKPSEFLVLFQYFYNNIIDYEILIQNLKVNGNPRFPYDRDYHGIRDFADIDEVELWFRLQ